MARSKNKKNRVKTLRKHKRMNRIKRQKAEAAAE